MTKEKAMYQTWLVLEELPQEEKKLISKSIFEEIQSTMEVDESIHVDFDVPLEKQNLDNQNEFQNDLIIDVEEKILGHPIINNYIEKEEVSNDIDEEKLDATIDEKEL